MKNAIKILLGCVVLLIVAAGLYAVLFASHTSPIVLPLVGPKLTVADDSGVTPESLLTLKKGTTAFGFNTFAQLNATNDSTNVFFSPFSLSTALTLLYEGAQGNTQKQMKDVLGYADDINSVRGAYASVINHLSRADSNYIFSSVNAYWIKKDFNVLDSYNSHLQRYYLSEAKSADFEGNPQGVSDEINKWASDNTSGRITNIVRPDMIRPLQLLLANAVYFKGKWEFPFKKDLTKEADFIPFQSSPIKVQMMDLGKYNEFKYFDNNDVAAVELPYQGGDLSMVVVLPKENSPAALTSAMTNETYTTIMDGMSEVSGIVSMPKFKFNTDYSLNDPLKALGISDVFDADRANLAGIDGVPDLFVSFVKQKAFVEVNEEGTEAAAVTVIGVVGSAMPVNPPKTFEFVADHPFYFVIKDNTTGTILFMGKVLDPR